MATTYKEIVSRITNILKLNNKDDSLSRRFILNLLKNASTTLISQRLLDRTISLETNLYTQISCFEFEKIDVKKCNNIEFRLCKTLMKSKFPLPKLVFSRLGASVKEISSLDGDYRFVFLDKGQYQRNKNRQYSLKDEVYIYLDTDNHLYIPDNEILTVDLTVLTVNPEEALLCSSCENGNCLESIYDTLFICPDKLQESVIDMTLQRLGITKQIIEDKNGNGEAGR